VWGDRYHARALGTPREVRNAIVYVLMNAKKHRRGAVGLDPCSSAWWFDGWKTPLQTGPPDRPVVELAKTWLLKTGWKRHGLIGRDERPATG
jgi:hypothetical protein